MGGGILVIKSIFKILTNMTTKESDAVNDDHKILRLKTLDLTEGE